MDEATREAQRVFALALSEEEVVAAVEKQPEATAAGFAITGLVFPPETPLVYIKYGAPVLKAAEARTQQWAFDALQQVSPADRQGIHIPEVYRVITTDGFGYIIMEFVRGKSVRDFMTEEHWPSFYSKREDYYGKIEKGLKLLLSLPAPQDVHPGPCGGGLIMHPLFKDYCASTEYDSVDTLEKHPKGTYIATTHHTPFTAFIPLSNSTVEQVVELISGRTRTLHLERELKFVFSDLYEGNFMFTDYGAELYIVDFEQANFLPISFMSCALFQQCPLCNVLRDRFDLPQDNVEFLRLVGGYLVMASWKIGKYVSCLAVVCWLTKRLHVGLPLV